MKEEMNFKNEISDKQFYIFGAGNTAIKVMQVLQNAGKSISSFIVTSKPSIPKINNIRVIELKETSTLDKNIPIIIAIFNREPNAFLQDIITSLKSFGFNKILTYPEFHSFFPAQLGDIFWLTDKNYYSENIEKYLNVQKLFKDPISKDTYSLIIEYLKTFDPSILTKPDFKNQYFPLDIDVWDGRGAFYDIGSFDGENIFDAYKAKGQLDLVIAFEPEMDNFQKIVTNPKLKDITKQFFIYPCGVWSETTMLKFETGVGESSSYSEHGNQIIPVVKIDEIIHTHPGYLKMDIEGAEIEALLGAKNTICKYKPSLAISIYHKPEHIYSIPELINSWDLGYNFYIRFHGNNLIETVLYCIQ